MGSEHEQLHSRFAPGIQKLLAEILVRGVGDPDL